MPRRLTPIPKEQINTRSEDPKYWEDILRREGLAMTRGLHPHVYIGGSIDIDNFENGAPLTVSGHYGTVAEPEE